MKSMLKNIALTAICTAVICPSAFARHADLIVPGKQLGKLHLQSYAKLPMGDPDYSDAGMNHEIMVWKSKDGNTLVLESTSNTVVDNGGSGYSVHYIRVTSPAFHDRHGLRTGSTFADVQREYPHLQAWDNKPAVLADNALGIAFEFDSDHPTGTSKCIAISVYEAGGGVWQEVNASDIKDLEKPENK